MIQKTLNGIWIVIEFEPYFHVGYEFEIEQVDSRHLVFWWDLYQPLLWIRRIRRHFE